MSEPPYIVSVQSDSLFLASVIELEVKWMDLLTYTALRLLFRGGLYRSESIEFDGT